MERIEASEYLWLLLAVVLYATVYMAHLLWKKRALRNIGGLFDISRLAPRSSKNRPWLKAILAVLILILMIVGIANPQTGSRMETVKRQGIDLIFAIDVSKSMLAEDVRPSRLDRGRQLVSACIDALGGDRVGIIAYAGEAFPQLPVTTDLAAAKLFLDGVSPDQVSSQGTSISQAVSLAADMFSQEGEHARALILLTDGEDHEGEVEDAIEKARNMGIRIFTIGLGNERGGPIPIKDLYGRTTGYKEDKDGNKVITKLNENLLRELSSKTDGQYFSGTDTRKSVEGLTEQFARMERSEFESSLFTDYEDQFYWFCGLALLLLFADSLILERKTKWFDRWLQ
jgi:Ca-activated chloride channel family protein